MMPSNRRQFLKLIGQQTGAPGRALKYDPAHCDLIQNMARDGQFPESWACEIGVTLETLRRWGYRYPEFHDATAMARFYLLHYWTQKLAAAIDDPTARAPMYRLLLRRFPAIYGRDPIDLCDLILERDAAEPSPADRMADEIKNMTSEEIEARLAILAARRQAATGN